MTEEIQQNTCDHIPINTTEIVYYLAQVLKITWFLSVWCLAVSLSVTLVIRYDCGLMCQKTCDLSPWNIVIMFMTIFLFTLEQSSVSQYAHVQVWPLLDGIHLDENQS